MRSAFVALGRTLPKGSSFVFTVSDDELFLKILRVPQTGKGIGSRFLSEVLALADAHRLPVRLQADPTDEPGDPDTLTLVRWYARFGFEPRRATDDGVWMERPSPAEALPAAALLANALALRDRVASRSELARWLSAARAAEGANASWRRPGMRA